LPSADLSGKPHQNAKRNDSRFVIPVRDSNPFNASTVSTFQRREACSLPFQYLLLDFFMAERIQKPVEPAPWGPKQGDGGGPRSPDVSRPDTKDLLKKMRKVDPNQSKRYRQRTGQ
jgi:hypothetical protein